MTLSTQIFCKKVIKYCVCGYIYLYHPYIGYAIKAIEFLNR